MIEFQSLLKDDQNQIVNLSKREHIDYRARKSQLSINELAYYGGTPYIAARLSRYAGESSLDWEGGTRDIDGSKITGRKEQSYCTPHLTRICDKINQYVFAKEPVRNGISEDIQENISIDGLSINRFMTGVSTQVTINRWCWIGIDVPEIANNIEQLSIAQKEALKIRPYWRMYTALQVPDWYINVQGELEWLITEEQEYVASDPLLPAQVLKVRRLWTKGGITKLIFDPNNKENVKYVEYIDVKLNKIPFILVNEISPFPHYFDNLEAINRTLMDLSSCNRANYFHSCFPQIYMPVSVLDSVMNTYGINADQATKKIIGYNYPILVGKDDIAPGYIMPDASSIGKMRDEINQLKEEMFETVGLLLRKSTKQAESAEAKAWDNVDLQAVMKQRAKVLEEAENKAVVISKQMDSNFSEFKTKYNMQFDTAGFEGEIKDIIKGKNTVENGEIVEETENKTE